MIMPLSSRNIPNTQLLQPHLPLPLSPLLPQVLSLVLPENAHYRGTSLAAASDKEKKVRPTLLPPPTLPTTPPPPLFIPLTPPLFLFPNVPRTLAS
jgi:hypothetical protein